MPLVNIERPPVRILIFRNNDTSSLGSSRQEREGKMFGTVWDTLIRNRQKVMIIYRTAEKDTTAATRGSQMGCMGRYVAKWYLPAQGRSINELPSVLVASLSEFCLSTTVVNRASVDDFTLDSRTWHGPLIQPSPFPETSLVIRLDMFSGGAHRNIINWTGTAAPSRSL